MAFDVGFAASAALLAGVGLWASGRIRGARVVGMSDTALLATLIVAVGLYFVVIPGFDHGDSVLTVVFATDLAALLIAAFATLAGSDRRDRQVGWWLVAACGVAAVGDGLAAARGRRRGALAGGTDRGPVGLRERGDRRRRGCR